MDALTIEDITKTYRLKVGRARVREMTPWPFDRALAAAFPTWWRKDTFDALHDVSFKVPAGSSLAIVGHNGAGKTTLLKVIARVTAPTRGRVQVQGRVAALLDVLSGFHPEMTGTENAYLLAAMHGLNRSQMSGRMEQAMDFAELGSDLADTPLKRYSAGMTARLGFGVMAAVRPEILLIDEILAVGDAAFQRKCIGWLDEYRRKDGTLLFVSHNLGLVRSMTDRAVWLDHGEQMTDGPTADVLAEYARALERRDPNTRVHKKVDIRRQAVTRGMDRWGAGGARIEEARVDDASNGGRVDIAIRFRASDLRHAIFSVGLMDEGDHEIGSTSSPVIGVASEGTVSCSMPSLLLRPGIYFPVVAILSPEGLVQDRWKLERAIVLEDDGVVSMPFGSVTIPAEWTAQ